MQKINSNNSIIGFYPNVGETKYYTPIEFLEFLQKIKDGEWQDLILPIRNIENKDVRQKRKKKVLPYVTISGEFSYRDEQGLIQHSGFIAVDLDDVEDLQNLKDKLSEDDYVFSIFVSASGRGLCVLIRIDGAKHTQAFEGIAYYFLDKYGLIVGACGDISRPRYVSYDPDLFLNTESKKFDLYLKENKDKPKKEFKEEIFVPDDFKKMCEALAEKNICEEYRDWICVGYALVGKLGEDGRNLFNLLSKSSKKYDEILCDKQYSALLKNHNENKQKKSGIATLYWHAKKHNIQITSKTTNHAVNTATTYLAAGSTKEATLIKLEEEGIGIPIALPIVNEIFNGNFVAPGFKLIDAVEVFLNKQGELKRNLITGQLEYNGKEITDSDVNELWRRCAKKLDKVSKEMINNILDSHFPKEYNPFEDFFEKYKDRQPEGVIKNFFRCIKSNTGVLSEYVEDFGTRWLVGLIDSMNGGFCDLMLVLIGKQNTGKTHFFTNLLPDELQRYFAKKDLGAISSDVLKRDLELTICNNILILDDEMSGKSKRDEKFIKQLLSTIYVTCRPSYGRRDVTRKRLAAFCGTTNDPEVLNDVTGNRRIIPINLTQPIDRKINEIDRIDLLMEAYWKWKSGYQWKLTNKNIKNLNINTVEFEPKTIEEELLEKYFESPNKQNWANKIEMTFSDILINIQENEVNYKMDKYALKRAIAKKGWKAGLPTRVDGKQGRYYKLAKVTKKFATPATKATNTN